MALLIEALFKKPRDLAERTIGRLLHGRPAIPPPQPSQVLFAEPPQGIEPTEPVNDLTIPKAVLRALRRNESIAALYAGDPENRSKALLTLGGIVLLDRNFQTSEVKRDEEGKYKGRVVENHVNRRWRSLQFSALDQIAAMGEEPQVALMLYAIVNTTRLAGSHPNGSAEQIERRIKRIEAELSPRHENIFHSFSFHWLPWHPSWRGAEIQSLIGIDEPDQTTVAFPNGSKIEVSDIDAERRKIKIRACELLGDVDGPNAVEALLKIGGGEYSSYKEIVAKALEKKGLSTTKAGELLASLGTLSVSELFRLSHEIAQQGLNTQMGVVGASSP